MNVEIDKLLGELERTSTPASLDRIRALVAALLEVHTQGLARIMAALEHRGEIGAVIAQDLLKDRAVESLLLLHGLHPMSLEDRVRAALDLVAPALRASGAQAVMLLATAGRVEIRLDAIVGGNPRSNVRTIVENALIEAAPDASIDISIGFDDAATFIPASRLSR